MINREYSWSGVEFVALCIDGGFLPCSTTTDATVMWFSSLLSDEPYDKLDQKWDYLYERANHLVRKRNKVIVIHLRIGTEEIWADRFF